MRTRDFLGKLDHDRIVAAIAAAEARTSGEIRVYIHRREVSEDVLAVAQRKFQQLGMDKTGERNGVLIFVAPRSRKFSVIGDEGIHKECGDEFWTGLVGSMRTHFQQENFTQALLDAINATGDLLARHFPRQSGDVNELPNEIIES